MIETSIFTALKTLVSNRCYPLLMPQSPTLPAIVYQRISNQPSNILDKSRTLDLVRIQIDCYSTTYSGAKTLASSVQSSMQTATFSATLQNDTDFFEAETDLYRVSLDYYVWERI